VLVALPRDSATPLRYYTSKTCQKPRNGCLGLLECRLSPRERAPFRGAKGDPGLSDACHPCENERMTQPTQSFAETALRLGGKSDEEASRMGAVDKADEQVELLFAPQYQTSSSPVHRAIWDGKVPLDLFAPPPLPSSEPCDAAMEKSLSVARRYRDAGTLLGADGKLNEQLLRDLGEAGYWGMLIDRQYGGQGASFA